MGSPRILVVDDEPDLRWVLRGLFEDAGFDVDEAEDGLAALGRLYRRDERWGKLANVLERRADLFEAAGETSRAGVMRHELGTLRAEKLGDLEGAIAKVVGDFDRIFRLVRNDTLRQSAVDLRDVGIRVLRNLEQVVGSDEPELSSDYVLVARELSIVDMFSLTNERVKGIVTREGGLTSHAAILARSMRIPTIDSSRATST